MPQCPNPWILDLDTNTITWKDGTKASLDALHAILNAPAGTLTRHVGRENGVANFQSHRVERVLDLADAAVFAAADRAARQSGAQAGEDALAEGRTALAALRTYLGQGPAAPTAPPPVNVEIWVPEHPDRVLYRAREPQPVGKLGEMRSLLTASIHEALWFPTAAECRAWIAANAQPPFVARSHMIVPTEGSEIARRLTGWTRRDLVNAEAGSPGKAEGFAVLPGTTPR